MRILLIVTPREFEQLASGVLPAAKCGVGFDSVYRIYRVPPGFPVHKLPPLDSQYGVESHVFETVDDARRWVEEHDRQRRLLDSAEVRA